MKPAIALVCCVAVAMLLVRWQPRRVIQLPPGVMEVSREIAVDGDTEVAGAPAGTVLRMAPGFTGRAAIVVRGNSVRLRDFTVDGDRSANEKITGLPPSNLPFARYTRANGILAEGVADLSIERVHFRNIAGFAVLVSSARAVTIDRVRVNDSGSRGATGHNNATGGILLEEGTADFHVTRSEFRNIRGNGIWTHSLYTSPRNGRGWFAGNVFENVGRDALQVGHATEVRVERNYGRGIGFPVSDVDMENRAVAVGIDTAGNVDHSLYADNRFEEIDGKCIDLDGFHDGEIRGNECINHAAAERYPFGNYGIVMNNSNPDMQSQNIRISGNRIEGPLFGAIFVIGTGHRIEGNRLLNLNTAHCNEEAARYGCYYGAGEPDMLRSGIYLGRGAERPAPARANVIENNTITGFQMAVRCLGLAPGVLPEWNTVRGNRCSN